MNIKMLVIIGLISSSAMAGDVGHSMLQEVKNAQKWQQEKNRVPNKVQDDSQDEDTVYHMENEPVELDMTSPPVGPKY